MPLSESDPRVFFAAERTLLAWLRTGITIMALGFVVSRFGLFVQLLSTQSKEAIPAAHSTLSAFLGVAFVMVGTLTIVFACIQHQNFISTLPKADLPSSYSRGFSVLLSILIGTLGVVLACYLLVAT